MIFRADTVRRRTVASVTELLLTVLAVVVPLLDGDRTHDRAVFDTEQHAASCHVGHDHTICSQFGANLGLSTARPTYCAPIADVQLSQVPAGTSLQSCRVEARSLPRAPPLV